MTQPEALAWIAELFDEKPDRLTAETIRANIQAWDSLGILTLMSALDNDFGIELSDDEVLGMNKVSDILEILHRHEKLNESALLR